MSIRSAVLFALSPIAFTLLLAPALQSQTAAGPQPPADPKALKSFQEGLTLERQHQLVFALDDFKKADKIEGNKCAACALKIIDLALALKDFKQADNASQELLALATTPQEQAKAHEQRASVLIEMGKAKKKQECFAEGEKESEAALQAKPNDLTALYYKGVCLADQAQDDAAKQVFSLLAAKVRPGSLDYGRISRYAERPELARARMAPAFRVTTLDGKVVSLDDLKDKVVLIDFWATWCGPCREALPHLRQLAQKLDSPQFVVLSISLDSDEQKWKDFVAKNGMTWPQYRDGGWNGNISKQFGVTAIPHTFTIDADGVLQDERVGDEGIEGKLKKLIAQARQRQEAAPAKAVAASVTGTP